MVSIQALSVKVPKLSRGSTMNRRSTQRLVAFAGATTLAMAALAGCSAGGGDDGGGGEGGTTLTWWHNAPSGPLPAVWEEVAAEFEEANPGVTVEQTGYQNEELQRTLIPNALAAGDPPDLFQVWPGGELRGQVSNDDLMESVGALREAGFAPSAVGAGDGWPAAHWWYQFALKSCSPETLAAAEADLDFSDPCWIEAGEQLQEFIGTD